jgi:hypothetical protein
VNCTRCPAAAVLRFDQDTAYYAVPTWSCPICGELHYDAGRYRPYKVGGVVYVRRGRENRVAWPFNVEQLGPLPEPRRGSS